MIEITEIHKYSLIIVDMSFSIWFLFTRCKKMLSFLWSFSGKENEKMPVSRDEVCYYTNTYYSNYGMNRKKALNTTIFCFTISIINISKEFICRWNLCEIKLQVGEGSEKKPHGPSYKQWPLEFYAVIKMLCIVQYRAASNMRLPSIWNVASPTVELNL